MNEHANKCDGRKSLVINNRIKVKCAFEWLIRLECTPAHCSNMKQLVEDCISTPPACDASPLQGYLQN